MPLFGSLTGSWVHVRSTHGVGPCMTKYGDTDGLRGSLGDAPSKLARRRVSISVP